MPERLTPEREAQIRGIAERIGGMAREFTEELDALRAERTLLVNTLRSLRSEEMEPGSWGIKCIEDHNAIIDEALAQPNIAEALKVEEAKDAVIEAAQKVARLRSRKLSRLDRFNQAKQAAPVAEDTELIAALAAYDKARGKP